MTANELTLWNTYRQGNMQSREKLILAYSDIVGSVVNRMAKSFPAHADKDDLRSMGMIGLIAAVEAYRLDRKCSFRTFAKIRVRGAVLDGLRASDWAPRSLRSRSREIEKARTMLANEFGCEPTKAEICEVVGITADTLNNHQQAYQRAAPVSLDAVLTSSDEHGLTYADKLADTNAISGEAKQVETCNNDALRRAIAKLTPQQQKVIGMFYFQNMNGREIASLFNVSESAISQIRCEAIRRMGTHGTLRRELTAV